MNDDILMEAPYYILESYPNAPWDEDVDAFVKENFDKWMKCGEFMGLKDYVFIGEVPVFLKKEISKEFIVDGKIKQDMKFSRFMSDNQIPNWMPTIYYSQALQIHREILKRGHYKRSTFNYEASAKVSNGAKEIGVDNIILSYLGSSYKRDIVAKGENELEAICNACVKFQEL